MTNMKDALLSNGMMRELEPVPGAKCSCTREDCPVHAGRNCDGPGEAHYLATKDPEVEGSEECDFHTCKACWEVHTARMRDQIIFSPEAMISLYEDQAYHKAVTMMAEAAVLGDLGAAKALATAVLQLMRLGYHRHPKRKVQ